LQLPESVIARRLADWPVARLATVAADGAPHQVPVVFARSGGSLWTPVDGKPKSGRELARVRNVRERPHVSLLLDEYSADWTQLWWIRVDAQARVVSPETPDQDTRFTAAREALRAKYRQYEEVPLLTGRPTLIELEISGTHSWCASEAASRV